MRKLKALKQIYCKLQGFNKFKHFVIMRRYRETQQNRTKEFVLKNHNPEKYIKIACVLLFARRICMHKHAVDSSCESSQRSPIDFQAVKDVPPYCSLFTK